MESGRMPAFLGHTDTDISTLFGALHDAHARTRTTSGFHLPNDPEISARNRYGDIAPFTRNRVRLRVADGQNDYINASPILLQGPTTGHRFHYIAAQGPKATTVSHFWRMVWHEVGSEAVIVMLTKTYDDASPVEKCFQYFPLSRSDGRMDVSDRMGSNDEFIASLELLELDFDSSIGSAVRKLRLDVNGQSKTVWHYLFDSWPDHSIPSAEAKGRLLNLIKVVRERVAGGAKPPVVHCSAGVGRSGTFIALDFLIRELESGALDNTDNSEKDYIFETVRTMREQRVMMVQSLAQFQLLYHIMRDEWTERQKRLSETMP